MKRISYISAILLISILVGSNWKCKKENACDCIHGTGSIVQETRQLPTFHSVYVEDNVNLIFQEDTVQRITVEAGKELIKLVKTEMKDDQLYIHNDNKCNFSRRYDIPINVYIHYVRNQFYTLKSKATSFITNTNPCTNDSIDLNIESSGDINFQVAGSGNIYTHQHGAGDVTLTGSCDQVIIYSVGTGFTTTDACTNTYTWVLSNTTGKITVDPSNLLISDIYGSGDVYYRGYPANINNTQHSTGKLIPLQ